MQNEDDDHTRYDQFADFVWDLSDERSTFTLSRSDMNGLVKVMSYFVTKEANIKEMFYYINRMFQKLALISIMKPLNPGEEHVRFREEFFIKVNEPLSFLALGEWSDIRVEQIPISLLSYGWSVHSAIDEFVFYHRLVKERFSKLYYTREDRLEKVMSLLKNPGFDLKPFLRDQYASQPNIRTLVVPDTLTTSPYRMLEWEYVDQFIDKLGPLLGYVNHFYYHFTGNSIENHSQYFRREFLATPDENVHVLTIHDYEAHIQNRTLYQLFDGFRRNNTWVKFDIPIMLKDMESYNLEFPRQVPITYTENSPAITTGTIYHYYQLKDNFYDPLSSDRVGYEEPQWLTDSRAKLFEPISYYESFRGSIESYIKYFSDITTDVFSFISRR